MSAKILDGTSIARQHREHLALRVADHRRTTAHAPGLGTILVGTDPASEVYVANKRRLASEIGIRDLHRQLPSESTHAQVADAIDAMAEDPLVSGILLQLPLPKHLDSSLLIDRIPPLKDVDGLTTVSAGRLARNQEGLRPCTPLGVLALLDATGVELDGTEAAVIGRSQLVGSPLAQMLTHRNATVTLAHSRTRNLAATTAQADIVIAAAGVQQLLGAEHVKRGAVVIDVGIHRTVSGLVGDVRTAEVADHASWITPVPGGVGPMTIAMLLANTLAAAELQSGSSDTTSDR